MDSRQSPSHNSAFVPIKLVQESPLCSSRRTVAAEIGNCRPPEDRALCQEFLHDLPADVGQPEVASHVPMGESLVIKPQQVQDRPLKVVDVYGIPDNVETAAQPRAVARPRLPWIRTCPIRALSVASDI